MARFYEQDPGYWFDSGDGLDMLLHQDNFWVWENRTEPALDMAQVTDPRDSLSWYWFREQLGEDEFEKLSDMAFKIGSFVLRDTPTEDVQDVWHGKNSCPNDIGDLDEAT